jgi:hypothetical protein
MVDELTVRVQTLEKKIVDAVNESNLPPIIVDLLLNNLLKEVKQAELTYEPQPLKEVLLDDKLSSDGNSNE